MSKLDGYKEGDRVRVTFEGVLKHPEASIIYVQADGSDYSSTFYPGAQLSPTFQIERIEQPLAPGETVRLRDTKNARPYELVAIRNDSGVLWGPLDSAMASGSGAFLRDLERIS